MVTKLQLGLLAFAGTVALVQGLAHLARRYGLVDIPDHRKDHARETPLVGGIAIFGGLLLAALAAEGLLVQRDALFIGLGLLLLTGMIDDRGGLTPAVRLSIQVAAALIMVLGGGVQLDNLGNLFGAGDVHLGAWSVPMTVFAVVGVINAMNMIDGADGLAGGVALIALLIFFAFSFSSDHSRGTLLVLLSFGVAAFMVFNARTPWRSRAAVFLGDAGSTMLGFALAWYAVELASVREVFTPITAVWILGIPLMDTVSLMIRRMFKGQSPFTPDREHLHHILQRAGYSHGQSVAVIWLLTLLMAAVGVGGWWLDVPEYAMFYAFMTLFALYFHGMRHAWKLTKLIRRAHGGQQAPAPEPKPNQD